MSLVTIFLFTYFVEIKKILGLMYNVLLKAPIPLSVFIEACMYIIEVGADGKKGQCRVCYKPKIETILKRFFDFHTYDISHS